MKATFDSVCASCHGLDGRGGERGPDIASRPEVVQKTNAQLFEVLQNGKPVTGMPSFAGYGSARLTALVEYVRSLQGRDAQIALPGNPLSGSVLFYGKARCSDCHMVSGKGGFFAVELTRFAAGKPLANIRESIVNPDQGLDPRRGAATILLANETKFSGTVRNQDNFSLQLQTLDGTFHLLNKSDIREIVYEKRSGMPLDYGSTLKPSEINDLLSFLMRTASSAARSASIGPSEDPDEEE